MEKRKVIEVHINFKSDGLSFTSTVQNSLIRLVPTYVAGILEVPSVG